MSCRQGQLHKTRRLSRLTILCENKCRDRAALWLARPCLLEAPVMPAEQRHSRRRQCAGVSSLAGFHQASTRPGGALAPEREDLLTQ